MNTVSGLVQKLGGRSITGNAARSYLATLHQNLSEDWERDLLESLIERNVKAGISISTINKIWPGLVTDVPYMRCSLIKDLPKKKAINTWPWARGIYSEIKADGMFANVSHHANGKVSIESRNGSPFPLEYFGDLILDVKASIPAGNQLHGELLIYRNGVMLPREEGNGVFNKLLQGGNLPIGDVVVYQAWDCIPISEAKPKNKYDVPYAQRFNHLKTMLKSTSIKSVLQLIEYKIVYSLKEAYEHCKEAMKRDLEGTVLKHPDAIWEDGTSQGQVKLKLEFVFEAKVVGFKAAKKSSKNAATFGSLECESSCGKLKFNVTGIKDENRKRIHKLGPKYLGTIISVCVNGIMLPDEETGGFFSVFLPRYLEDRLDKTEADSLERIQQIQQEAIDLAFEMGEVV
jgi:DNA ligase-1